MDLRSRLSRIRGLRPAAGTPGKGKGENSPAPRAAPAGLPGAFKKGGWIPAASPAESGALVLRRTQTLGLPLALPHTLPAALGILAPGGGGIPAESLRFFDLETTGLSIGAGTLPFLAAVGVLEQGGKGLGRIRVVQYLLLDYPGEGEFLESLAGDLGNPAKDRKGAGEDSGAAAPPTVVSYNGKTFDIPILRNRCTMLGLGLPGFDHLDLLHSARRVWRGVLPSCSQAAVETEILSLSREGDLPGAFAPEAWFEFLRTGNPAGVLRIGDHNCRDILGMAAILACLCRIAADPLGEGARFSANPEQLALCWQRALDRGCRGEEEVRRARDLLERGAALGYPRCCRKLAVEAEWRTGDIGGALDLVERALGRDMPEGLRLDLAGRRERLLGKAAKARKKGRP